VEEEGGRLFVTRRVRLATRLIARARIFRE